MFEPVRYLHPIEQMRKIARRTRPRTGIYLVCIVTWRRKGEVTKRRKRRQREETRRGKETERSEKERERERKKKM